MGTQIQKFKLPQLLLSLLIGQNANADVNMKNASFLLPTQDINYIDITKTYNSRSLHNGIFGFGWCSNLEKQLQINNKDQILLSDCNKENKIEFNKIENKPFKVIYQAKGNGKNLIVLEGGAYAHVVDQMVVEKYNLRGQLSYFQSSGGTTVVTYEESGRLARVLRGDRVIHVMTDLKNNKIKTLSNQFGIQAAYEYENDNLIKVSNPYPTYFKYDNLNNLIEIIKPNKEKTLIFYDKDRDWVIRIEKPDFCTENYEYLGDDLYQRSILTKKCNELLIKKYLYEFWYQIESNTKYLSKAKITTPEKSLEIFFDPQTGKPLERKPTWKN